VWKVERSLDRVRLMIMEGMIVIKEMRRTMRMIMMDWMTVKITDTDDRKGQNSSIPDRGESGEGTRHECSAGAIRV
jgi:hypothetical protein